MPELVTWAEFVDHAPSFADAGRRLLHDHEIAYLATVRRDGAPRLHPVVPIETASGLYIAVNCQSPKRWDLARDRRYALHAALGANDEEFVITGRVRRVEASQTRREISDAASHVIHGSDWLFEFLIAHCLHGHWVNVGQPDTYPVREQWRAS